MPQPLRRPPPAEKPGLHPRNRYRARYDFAALTRAWPALAPFVAPTGFGDVSIDFADPAAVLALNQALLKRDYGITDWALPPGYLCPPIPGRADYLHHVADLLARVPGDESTIPRGPEIAVLDLGAGANCIYPILGVREYGWSFVGTESDPTACRNAQRIVEANAVLRDRVTIRRQTRPPNLLRGVVKAGEFFDLVVCNPPFHASPEEAAASTERKVRNLSGRRTTAPVRNFGGQPTELWCEGGEVAFILRLIEESVDFAASCGWFTTLVAQQDHLPPLYAELHHRAPAAVRTLDLAHGQKKTRVVAWTFHERAGRRPAASHTSTRQRSRFSP